MNAYIRAGYGFDVGYDFARAWDNLPIELAPAENAAPRHIIGYISGDPNSKLGFLRDKRIRVHVPKTAIGPDGAV
jgi:hypothetical protein